MVKISSGRRFYAGLLCATAILSLSACSSDGESGPSTSLSSQAAPQVTDKAILYGEKRESFSTVERLYNAHPDDDLIGARYAKALRESGDIKKAKRGNGKLQ